MNTLLSREERTNEAMRHQQECLAKYGETLGREKAYNFHLWWHEVQYEVGGYKYNVRENPKPYSDFYQQHFIEKYFSYGSENNLIWNLTNEFIGDKIDAEYIETLLITVKNYGLFKPGAVVVFDNDGPGSVSCFEPPSEGYYYEQTRNVASSQVLWGSEANQDIAKVIQRWLKRRAKELALPNNKGQAPTDYAQAFSQLFALNFTIAHCDALMAKVLVGQAYEKPTNLSAKIWALLHVLERNNLLNCTAVEAAQVAGNYYGYSMAAKPSKVADGKPYGEASKKIDKAVKDAIAHKEYGPNYS